MYWKLLTIYNQWAYSDEEKKNESHASYSYVVFSVWPELRVNAVCVNV